VGIFFAVQALALLSDGRLASGDEGGKVRLWGAARGGDAIAVLEGTGTFVEALAVLPDGRRLAAGAAGSSELVVWDTGVVPPTRCATIDCGSGLLALAVLRDGRLAAGGGGSVVQLVEVGTSAGAIVATLEGHTGVVAALVELPDGTLASGSHDKTVRLWDVGARACVATLAGHTGGVSALAVLNDGRLASGSYDSMVRLWDVVTRACVAVLKGHTHDVFALAALPDGRLVSGSGDKTIRVWNTRPAAGVLASVKRVFRRGTPSVVLKGHTGTSNVVALQPLPGGRLASGSNDKMVRLWHLSH